MKLTFGKVSFNTLGKAGLNFSVFGFGDLDGQVAVSFWLNFNQSSEYNSGVVVGDLVERCQGLGVDFISVFGVWFPT